MTALDPGLEDFARVVVAEALGREAVPGWRRSRSAAAGRVTPARSSRRVAVLAVVGSVAMGVANLRAVVQRR